MPQLARLSDPLAQNTPVLLLCACFWHPGIYHSASHRTSCFNSPFSPPALQLSVYMLHACLHSYAPLLQSLLSHCLFVILSFYSVGLSDAARCHYAAVTAGAGAITRHTHHGKHTCLCAFMYLHITHTHKQAHTSQCLCPQCFWWLLELLSSSGC